MKIRWILLLWVVFMGSMGIVGILPDHTAFEIAWVINSFLSLAGFVTSIVFKIVKDGDPVKDIPGWKWDF